jgi:PAS domain S-box-containing protein
VSSSHQPRPSNAEHYESAHRARELAEERLALAMTVAAFALAEVDYTAGMVQLSAEAAALYGLGAAAAVMPREQIHATFHPDERAELERVIAETLRPDGDGWFVREHRVVWPDGQVRWLNVRKQVFFDRASSPGRPVSAVLVAQDITERRRAEERLRESEARLRLATEAAAMFSWESDLRSGTITWSANAAALIGCAPEDLPTADADSLFFVAPEEAPRLHREHAEMLARRATSYSYEFRGRWPEEAPRYWQAQGAIRYDAGGAPVSVYGLTQDITARKRAEDALHGALEREQALRRAAEEASRLKDEFLATVSHELRTPLTAFLGYAELLQRRPRDEAYIARAVEKMVRSAKAQAALIEDLLDVSRVIGGQLRINRQPAELVAVIHAALDTVRPAIEAKGLLLQIDLDRAASAVLGDPSRLQQVVWNLLSNATKFTPPGGCISVRLVRDGGESVLSIGDSGQGIAPAFLPFVFDRFSQADSSSQRTHGGLGLGLAIVRHLVELHGGAVTATSDGDGRGATFMVRLPLAPVGLSGPAAAAPALGPAPAGLVGLRVLVVDDQPAILELLEELLAAEGAEVRACATAGEALDQLRSWRPDVLISDIAMPGADGLWLIRQVRRLARAEGGATPALALTAFVRTDDQQRLLAAGFQHYLPKPVDAGALRRVVAGLGGRREDRET